MTISEWMVKGETGLSSETIWAHFVLGIKPNHPRAPSDPSDFLRCYWLLQIAPEWRPRMKELGERYPHTEWPELAEHWEELTKMLEEIWPESCRTGKYHDEPAAVVMYMRMREFRSAARKRVR